MSSATLPGLMQVIISEVELGETFKVSGINLGAHRTTISLKREGHQYVVSDLIEGKTIQERIKSVKRLVSTMVLGLNTRGLSLAPGAFFTNDRGPLNEHDESVWRKHVDLITEYQAKVIEASAP